LLVVVAIAIAGAIVSHRLPLNGSLIVSTRGQLEAIDADGLARPIASSGEKTMDVSRSPDGQLAAFWTVDRGGRQLKVVRADGSGERELPVTDEISSASMHRIDTWSWDSQFLATEVPGTNGSSQIVIVDVAAGSAQAITPASVVAHSPLWSPDGKWVAFIDGAGRQPEPGSLDAIRIDGTGLRTISADVSGGPDTWSPDGTWIYFDSRTFVFRVNVVTGVRSVLAGPLPAYPDGAYAPASSPDGTRIAYIRPWPAHNPTGWHLFSANSDGTAAHLLLRDSTNDGWSADGQSILGEWTPHDGPGGLVAVNPETGAFDILLAFDTECRKAKNCLAGVGWGQARP
jgi:TolB protein